MPYPSIADVPEHVKGDKARRRWMEVYNSVFEKTGDEKKAFAAANATLTEVISESLFKETLQIRLTESSSDGSAWDVIVIEEGFSGNGTEGPDGKFYQRYYPRAVIEKIAKLIEGARAFTYGLKPDHQDHLPVSDEKPILVDNLAGWFSDAKIIETVKDGITRAAVAARFNFDERAAKLKQALKAAWDRGKRDYLGFSIDAMGVSHLGAIGNQLAQIVDDVKQTESFSADIVSNPAAGGRFERLVASMQRSEGGTQMDKLKKLMLKMIEIVMPDAMKGKDETKMEAKEAVTLFSEAIQGIKEDSFANRILRARLIEAQSLIAAEKYDEAGNIIESLIATPAPSKETLKSEPVKPQPDPVIMIESVKRLDAIETRIKLAECKAELVTKLQESKLPEITAKKVEATFRGRIFESAQLEDAIKQEREYLAALSGTGRVEVPGQDVQLRESERDRLGLAMFGFFMNEDQKDSAGKIVPRFRSFRKAAAEVFRDPDVTPNEILAESYRYIPPSLKEKLDKKDPRKLRLLESMDTTSWGQIFGDNANKALIRAYAQSPLQAWRLIVSDITGPENFMTQHRMIVGGYGTLPTVAEGGTYQPLTSPTDDENTYAVVKRGGTEDITEEMIAGDQVGAIRRIPMNMGRAAVYTLYQAVYNTLSLNTATCYDGLVLFSGAGVHLNLGTVALSSAELSVVRAAMRTQTNYGATETLGEINKPILLIVPNELEALAMRLSTSDTHVFAIGAETATTPNPHKGIAVHVVDHWTDATDWFVAADPKNVPMLEVGFYQGREDPELWVQDEPTVGSRFSADKITTKIRHIWGIMIEDYRGLYRETVAG